jgi:preprotein translocase subunit SecG
MTFLFYLFLTLLIVVSIFLILLILIQKGRGGGLSTAFGGGGGSSAFGTKTGDVLTWATSIIFGIFILLAVAVTLVVNSQYGHSASTVATPTDAPLTPAGPGTPAPPPSQPPLGT